MTGAETIARINAKLQDFDDEAVQAVVDLVQEIGKAGKLPRRFTDRERELIEQSKADFREGQTYSLEEAKARSNAFLEALRVKYPNAS